MNLGIPRDKDESNEFNSGKFNELGKIKFKLNYRRLEILNRIWSELCSFRQQLISNQVKFIFTMLLLLVLSIILAFGTTNLILGLYPETIEKDILINLPFNLGWWIAGSIILFCMCLLLEEGVYRLFISNKSDNDSKSYFLLANILILIGVIQVSIIFIVNLIYFRQVDSNNVLFPLLLSAFLSITLFISSAIAGYLHYESAVLTKNIANLENDIQLGNLIEEFRAWIRETITSLNKDQLAMLKKKYKSSVSIRNLKVFAAVLTAPFVSFGASNTVANFFPDAGIIRLAGIRFNPIIWIVLTIAVMIAFILITKGFVKSKEMHGSDVIINDGYSNFEAHGIDIKGPKDWRGDKKQRLLYWIGSACILIIELSTNLVYFVQTQGDEAFILALMIALIPTLLLICEAVAVSQDVYKCSVQKYIIENAGENLTLL